METRPDPRHLRELCEELDELATRLGRAVTPDPPGEPDRSNQMRPALLWCATHAEPHRRDRWRDGCTPGQDPRRASVLVAPALAGTPPRHGVRRRAPASRAPLDLELLAARRAIETVTLDLAARAREALGDVTRDTTPAEALRNLPMLLGRLDPAHVVVREALGDDRRDGVLARRRRRARIALDLDRRPLTLAPCPSVQDDYLATWAGGYEPAAEWADGVCREYAPEASAYFTRRRREAYAADVEAGLAEPGRDVEPVEIWYRSVLYVLDPEAPAESDGAAVRCPGCGRAWRTNAEKARLREMTTPDLGEPPEGEPPEPDPSI